MLLRREDEKMQDKEKKIRTMPEGIWESSRPKQVNREAGSDAEKTADDILRAQGGAADERADRSEGGRTSLGGQGMKADLALDGAVMKDGALAWADGQTGDCLGSGKNSTPDPSLTMDWQGNGYPGQPRSRTASDNS